MLQEGDAGLLQRYPLLIPRVYLSLPRAGSQQHPALLLLLPAAPAPCSSRLLWPGWGPRVPHPPYAWHLSCIPGAATGTCSPPRAPAPGSTENLQPVPADAVQVLGCVARR